MTDQPTDDAFDSEPPDAPANGKTAKRTDLSNAEALRRLHGENLRYVGAWRKWLAWDGMRWVLDTDALALHYASETVRVLCQEALDECGRVNLAMKVEGVTAELQDAKKDADADLAHAVSSQNARKMTAALQVATSFREFATRHDDLDADPWNRIPRRKPGWGPDRRRQGAGRHSGELRGRPAGGLRTAE